MLLRKNIHRHVLDSEYGIVEECRSFSLSSEGKGLVCFSLSCFAVVVFYCTHMTRHLSHDSHMTFFSITSLHCIYKSIVLLVDRAVLFLSFSYSIQRQWNNPNQTQHFARIIVDSTVHLNSKGCVQNVIVINSTVLTMLNQLILAQVCPLFNNEISKLTCLLSFKAITHPMPLYRHLRIFFKMKPFLVQLK